jgi:hypothetical protein
MPSISYRYVLRVALIAMVAVLMSGCGVTLSPVKRAPLQISPMETSLRPVSQKVLVRFESTLPSQPLAETVWDNVSGPFADAVESKQIGFTQDYSTLIPATVVGGAVAGAVVGTQPEYTRIVIPFGRIFEEVFESGLQKVFPNSLVCSDDSSESKKLRSAAPAQLIRLKVTKFQVWEKPLNHLNLKATMECKVYRAAVTDQPAYVFEIRHEVANQSIGSIVTTSAGFIREMNKISNSFADVLSEEILENLWKRLGE